jgi:predicted nucleotidyltransferase
MQKKHLKAIAEAIAAHKTVELAYIFGSQAKRTRRKARDLDIAVLLTKKPSAEAKLRFLNDLCSGLQKIAKTEIIDVVILNDASPFLKHQVLKYGKCIFERNEKSDSRFRYAAISEYLSVKSLHDFFVKQMYRRHGVRHG